MQAQIEVAIIKVADVDRALVFYVEQLGFTLDVDYRPAADFRVVQLTPPGSSCSVQLEHGSSGGAQGFYLVVRDIEAAIAELRDRGVTALDVRHKAPRTPWVGGWAAGIDPERVDYASFADVVDPDGNRWVLQERGHRSSA